MTIHPESLTPEPTYQNEPVAVDPKKKLKSDGFTKAAVTQNGQELFAQNPELLESFSQAAQELMLTRKDLVLWNSVYKIGSGKAANVYELPEAPNLCIKLTSPETIKIKAKYDQRLAVSVVSGSNGFVELDVMDHVHRRLARAPEHRVYTPAHYAAVSARGRGIGLAYAVLEERLPDGLISFRDYLKGMGVEEPADEPQLYGQLALKIINRLDRAMGHTALGLSINDFAIKGRRSLPNELNDRNTLLQEGEAIEEAPMYVIDIAGQTRGLRRVVSFIGRLAA